MQEGHDQNWFLGEEEEAGGMEGKRGEHSPWRMADKAGTAALKGKVEGLVEGKVVLVAVRAKESSPPSPLQSTEASVESA